MIKERVRSLIKKIKFSHLICLCIGLFIPLYIHALFVDGFNSSSVSAIMDTVMAIVATYTALHVVSWLDSRLNDKAFEEANYCITSLLDAKNKTFEIRKSIEDIYTHSGSKDRDRPDNEYNILRATAKKHLTDFEIILTNLNTKLSIIKIWGLEVKPDKKKELDNIIKLYIDYLGNSERLISCLHDVHGIARKKDYEYHAIAYNSHSALTQILPNTWFTSWKGLFQVSKSTSSN